MVPDTVRLLLHYLSYYKELRPAMLALDTRTLSSLYCYVYATASRYYCSYQVYVLARMAAPWRACLHAMALF